MRRNRFISYIIIFLTFSFTNAQLDSKNYLVRTINSEINIDGIGDEIEWSKSKWESNFWMWRPTDSLQAKKQTRFKLIRNDKYLFILIESDTDGKNFNTPNLKRDFSTYPTDYLTLLFDTFNDGTNAFSFATNPLD